MRNESAESVLLVEFNKGVWVLVSVFIEELEDCTLDQKRGTSDKNQRMEFTSLSWPLSAKPIRSCGTSELIVIQ